MSEKNAAGLELPPDEKISFDWLKKHDPIKWWISFGALLLGAFGAGVTAGQLSFVREIVDRTDEKKIQHVPPPVSPTPGPSMPVANIEIRSPLSGAHVSGETNFAASVIGMRLSDYKMSWLVDKGQLNPMDDSNESEPHKEAKVDVTKWNWKKKCEPYVITFVATDSNGSRIAERSINIFVDPK